MFCLTTRGPKLPKLGIFIRDVPVIHPVPGKCQVSHYSVLSGPGQIMGPSNKKKFFFYFLLFITVSKKSYRIVDKNILCQIKNIQSYKLVFCVQYFLIFTVWGHPFMTSTKKSRFCPPLPPVHMGRTPSPLVDVHTRS